MYFEYQSSNQEPSEWATASTYFNGLTSGISIGRSRLSGQKSLSWQSHDGPFHHIDDENRVDGCTLLVIKSTGLFIEEIWYH